MGVKDKDNNQGDDSSNSQKNKENNSMNAKRTYEEFKQSASMENSDVSFDESSSFSFDEEEKASAAYEIYEQVDCRDKENRWLNAEIIAIRNHEVRVHYTGFPTQKDEWIEKNSSRLQKQWKLGQEFRLFNRIDVFIDFDDKHFEKEESENYRHNKFWQEGIVMQILKQQIKVLVISLSNNPYIIIDKDSEKIAEIGTFSSAFGCGKKSSKIAIKVNDLKKKEEEFIKLLARKNLQIKPVGGDGNCLFRAVSDQIYNNEIHHRAIRRYCLDYIELEENFFKNYVVQGNNPMKFKEYLLKKREDGVWGDDIEIQALSEIYLRPIEIYAYSDKPMRTFHETSNDNSGEPIRLSYHGQSHFNSIIKINGPLLKHPNNNESFGIKEEMALMKARGRKEHLHEEKELRIVRDEFENKGNRDLETALQESLMAFEDCIKKLSFKCYEEEENERLLVQQTIEESSRFSNSTINKVVNEGFPLEMVLQAYAIVGDDPELMVKFITENLALFH